MAQGQSICRSVSHSDPSQPQNLQKKYSGGVQYVEHADMHDMRRCCSLPYIHTYMCWMGRVPVAEPEVSAGCCIKCVHELLHQMSTDCCMATSPGIDLNQ